LSITEKINLAWAWQNKRPEYYFTGDSAPLLFKRFYFIRSFF